MIKYFAADVELRAFVYSLKLFNQKDIEIHKKIV